MTPPKPTNITTPLKVPRDHLAALKRYAAMRERSLAGELRIAVGIHLRHLGLAHLDTPEGQAEIAALGLDLDAEKALIAESLQAISQTAFTPYTAPSLDHRVGLT